MAKQATVTYPEELPQTLQMSDTEFVQALSFLAAAKLYELGRLSAGKAAKLAGMERLTFLRRLSEVNVPAINLRDEEIVAEIQAAYELAEVVAATE